MGMQRHDLVITRPMFRREEDMHSGKKEREGKEKKKKQERKAECVLVRVPLLAMMAYSVSWPSSRRGGEGDAIPYWDAGGCRTSNQWTIMCIHWWGPAHVLYLYYVHSRYLLVDFSSRGVRLRLRLEQTCTKSTSAWATRRTLFRICRYVGMYVHMYSACVSIDKAWRHQCSYSPPFTYTQIEYAIVIDR